MIYACLRFIEEWAHPLTLVNYIAARPGVGRGAGERAGGAGGRDRALRSRAPLALVATLVAGRRRARWPCAATRRCGRAPRLQIGDRHRLAAAGADVDGHVGRVVQHARVLPPRAGRGSARGSSALPTCCGFALPASAAVGVARGALSDRACVARAARAGARPARRSLVLLRAGASTRRTCTTRSCPDAAQPRSRTKLQTRCSRRRPLPRAPLKRASMRSQPAESATPISPCSTPFFSCAGNWRL